MYRLRTWTSFLLLVLALAWTPTTFGAQGTPPPIQRPMPLEVAVEALPCWQNLSSTTVAITGNTALARIYLSTGYPEYTNHQVLILEREGGSGEIVASLTEDGWLLGREVEIQWNACLEDALHVVHQRA